MKIIYYSEIQNYFHHTNEDRDTRTHTIGLDTARHHTLPATTTWRGMFENIWWILMNSFDGWRWLLLYWEYVVFISVLVEVSVIKIKNGRKPWNTYTGSKEYSKLFINISSFWHVPSSEPWRFSQFLFSFFIFLIKNIKYNGILTNFYISKWVFSSNPPTGRSLANKKTAWISASTRNKKNTNWKWHHNCWLQFYRHCSSTALPKFQLSSSLVDSSPFYFFAFFYLFWYKNNFIHITSNIT